MKLKTLPIFMAFVVMGVADAMGPLSDAVKTQYELSNVMATMLSFFVFIAFAAFSVPGGLFFVGAVASLVGGLLIAWWWFDRRSRLRHGGFRIY